MTCRYIAHIDMDAFFASVEQRDDPSLRLKPVIVGSDPKGGRGRGVVSTCSYEARKFGIHSGMPIGQAWRLCPKGHFLIPDMEKYCQAAHEMIKVLFDFTPLVEPLSLDEAFLDITGSFHLFGSPAQTCLKIKQKIYLVTGLTASCGLAPNKLLAKIASDLKKPDGFVEVNPNKIENFLKPLSAGKLWGVGEKTAKILLSLKIKTIGDLADCDPVQLSSMLGKSGQDLWLLAQGIDDRPVETLDTVKSVGNELTFEKDLSSDEKVLAYLSRLSEKVSLRLRADNIKGRTITLKLRLEGFKTYTRSVTVDPATNYVDIIFSQIKRMYQNFERKGKRVRLVGVKVSNFGPDCQQFSLFDLKDRQRESVHLAMDKIKAKFGNSSICRALSLNVGAGLASCWAQASARKKD